MRIVKRTRAGRGTASERVDGLVWVVQRRPLSSHQSQQCGGELAPGSRRQPRIIADFIVNSASVEAGRESSSATGSLRHATVIPARELLPKSGGHFGSVALPRGGRRHSPDVAPRDLPHPCRCVEHAYSLVRVSATIFICSRNALRPTLLVARQAFRARSRNACSAGATETLSRTSSSQPAGLPWCCSICRASLSPIGRDDLIWLHMLGEICKVAAKVCSSPFGEAPEASAFSA